MLLTGLDIGDMLIQRLLKLTWPITGDKIAKLETFKQLIISLNLGMKDFTIFRTVIFGADIFLIQLLQFPEITSMAVMDFHCLMNKNSKAKVIS